MGFQNQGRQGCRCCAYSSGGRGCFLREDRQSAIAIGMTSGFFHQRCIPTTCQFRQSLETNNNVWGRTLNPFNRTVTPGGSSGGEGALVAVKGSPLGIGTDIGGSIVRSKEIAYFQIHKSLTYG